MMQRRMGTTEPTHLWLDRKKYLKPDNVVLSEKLDADELVHTLLLDMQPRDALVAALFYRAYKIILPKN